MKKIIASSIGLLIGLLTVLFFNEYIKGVIVAVFLKVPVTYSVFGISLKTSFVLSTEHHFLIYMLIFISPMLVSILLIEAASFFLRKTDNNHFKAGLLVFQMINVGYIILNLFLGIYSTILKSSFTIEWIKFFTYEDYSFNQKLIVLFFMLILFFGYLNYLSKRLRRYVPRVRQADS